jgi:NAD+ diphosphatase
MMTSEFVSPLSLSRYNHDRDSGNRSRQGHLDEVWARDTTRVLVLSKGKAFGSVVADPAQDEGFELAFLSPQAVSSLNIEVVERIYLGKADHADEHFVAIVVGAEAREVIGSSTLVQDTREWGDLRVWGHAMSPRDTGLFTQALALANWHASHLFSPTSGEPTQATSAGWVRTSTSNQQMFPRTDVAVIVLVTDDDDRILLGNNAMWESNRYSLLAGYVDPGEALEAAVEREVFEESGLRIDRAEYVGSQPWPFPASLMVGFVARVRPDAQAADLHPDGEEILSLRWFSRDELRASLDDIVLPGRTSIARALIEKWYGEPLDQNAVWLGSR